MKTLVEKKKEYKDAIRALSDLYDQRIEEHKKRIYDWKSHPPLKKALTKLETLQSKERKLKLAIKVVKQSLKHYRMEYTKLHPLDKMLTRKIASARNRMDKLSIKLGYSNFHPLQEWENAVRVGCSYYKSKRNAKK